MIINKIPGRCTSKAREECDPGENHHAQHRQKSPATGEQIAKRSGLLPHELIAMITWPMPRKICTLESGSDARNGDRHFLVRGCSPARLAGFDRDANRLDDRDHEQRDADEEAQVRLPDLPGVAPDLTDLDWRDSNRPRGAPSLGCT